jgi:hypothetical protein
MASKHLNRFPTPLLDDLVAGRWLPVVGAGFSRNAVLPPNRIGGRGLRYQGEAQALSLTIVPAHVLVDGKPRIAGCRLLQTPIVEGDARSVSIAAASIVAKVTPDGLMTDYARL